MEVSRMVCRSKYPMDTVVETCMTFFQEYGICWLWMYMFQWGNNYMMQSITCVICTIKTWITSMSNLVVGPIVAQGVIIHEVCNNRNRNNYWRFHIAWGKYSTLASRLVIIVNPKIARICQRCTLLWVFASSFSTSRGAEYIDMRVRLERGFIMALNWKFDRWNRRIFYRVSTMMTVQRWIWSEKYSTAYKDEQSIEPNFCLHPWQCQFKIVLMNSNLV